MSKIYISLSHIKILYSVYKLLSKKNNHISRADIINDSGVDKRTLSANIQNKYLLEEAINQDVKTSNSLKWEQEILRI